MRHLAARSLVWSSPLPSTWEHTKGIDYTMHVRTCVRQLTEKILQTHKRTCKLTVQT